MRNSDLRETQMLQVKQTFNIRDQINYVDMCPQLTEC